MINRVKVEIVGKNIDYFFKEIIKKEIPIYDIKKNKDKLYITIDYQDYLNIKEMKTTYKINVISRYGVNKYKYLIKRNLYFIVFFIMSILINIFLSNIIFKVEVIHPNKKIVNIIKNDLQEYGLKKYNLKPNYKKKEIIKNNILKKEKNIINWIEIEEKGTKYIVKIEERKEKKKNTLCKERNLVAKKNAIIIDINASNGEIIKRKNDYVAKGEVIVSGLIYNKEKIVSKRCATGNVYGEVWYKVKISLPRYYFSEEKINKKAFGIIIKIFNKEYKIPNTLRNYKKKEYNIIENNIVPIKLSFATYQKMRRIKHQKSQKMLEKEALEETTKQFKKKLKKQELILGKKVLKIEQNNSKINMEVFVKVKEDITNYQDISNLNIEEINEMNKKEE